MKKVISILLCCVCFLTVMSCRAREDDSLEPMDTSNPYFVGKVVEIYETRCLVKITDTGNGNFTVDDTIIVNTDIENCPEYEVGDCLRVSFDGKVALSYPAQVLCVYSIIKTDSHGNRIR